MIVDMLAAVGAIFLVALAGILAEEWRKGPRQTWLAKHRAKRLIRLGERLIHLTNRD